jgi:phage tail-like protein
LAGYPLTSFYFHVAISGAGGADAAFQEVSGLGSEWDVEEVREGGENAFVHRLPTRVKRQNLVLKRGAVDHETALFVWCAKTFEQGLGARIIRNNIVVKLLDPDGAPVLKWSFWGAWPVKLDISGFNAKESEVAIETLEFAYQSMDFGYTKGASKQAKAG